MRQVRLMLAAIVTLLAVPALGADGIVITCVGDIMLAGSATPTLSRSGYDYPFAKTAQELRRGDIAMGNLEAPLTERGTEYRDKTYRFRTNPIAAAALKRAGFSVLTLANNHMMDYGNEGLQDTLATLSRHGIAHTGAGASLAEARREAVVSVRGKRIAFLAYSLTFPSEFYAGPNRPGTAPGYAPHVREDIRRAKAEADYVVVSFHWGAERAEFPKQYQTETARLAIDAGADAIIGHHPHVLQGIEFYRGKPILYSLGNFAFGSRSTAADRSVMARLTLSDEETSVELVPLNVLHRETRYQPGILAGRKGAEVIERLNRLSQPFGTVISGSAGRFRARTSGADQRIATR
ncbi:Capsule synthesis protein, CapA [Geobacter metallireducens RCH3]|uniref:Poly-gamma-glutamate capsule biosynthesis protein, putative n=1 Tax=Geobacter metallireducens (strain ATCC 53774 / DSM 7210 / GS-15) TaxID=269799 RepID=Q39PU0_GEOMG|nr:CapA family protein [Geobacter metallireducens]ABB33734.1 poly-gamma-glutamate capsule biosynthesis protein, putative [Geobacter metallireducens GS-15]EHP85714.1 Capsule synthesis protein, CapA [Geobacter metallireducens RCH3]